MIFSITRIASQDVTTPILRDEVTTIGLGTVNRPILLSA